jgi:hypothetical protein
MKGGYRFDDGTEIDPLTIPLPSLCKSCLKFNNAAEEVPCTLNRMDQMDEIRKGEIFCCFAYEPLDSSINKQYIFQEMERYLAGKHPISPSHKKKRTTTSSQR